MGSLPSDAPARSSRRCVLLLAVGPSRAGHLAIGQPTTTDKDAPARPPGSVRTDHVPRITVLDAWKTGLSSGRSNHGALDQDPSTHIFPQRDQHLSRQRHDRRLAPRSPIRDLLHRRLQPFCYLHDCSGCFRLKRSPGRARTHWKAPPSHGAQLKRTLLIARCRSRRGKNRLNSSRPTPASPPCSARPLLWQTSTPPRVYVSALSATAERGVGAPGAKRRAPALL